MKNHLTFICTKDIHYAGQNPKARLDNYQEALTAKIREIFDIAREYAADGILIAGDLFDSFYTSLPVIAEYAALLKESPCPIYTIAGQHDEESHNPGSLRRSPYGLLVRLGIVHDAATSPITLYFNNYNYDTENVVKTEIAWGAVISGRHYDWEADKKPDYYCRALKVRYNDQKGILEECTNLFTHIHLAHGTLVDHYPPFDRYTHIDNLQTNADVLVVGDYHPGIGIIKRINEDTSQQTLVVDPGALARQKASTSDMTRQVQVAILTVTAEGCSAELLPLRCAKPGDEVLTREHLEEEEAREDRKEAFLGLLREGAARKFAETREIMDAVAAQGNVPGEVIEEALDWVAKAREELNK